MKNPESRGDGLGTRHTTAPRGTTISTIEGGLASSASQPDVIDDTDDAAIGGSSLSVTAGEIGASAGSTAGSERLISRNE